MQKPFFPFYTEFTLSTPQYQIYKNIERKGWKNNEYDLEAIIENAAPLVISFSSTKSEIGQQSSYLNPKLWAQFSDKNGVSTRIAVEIRSAVMIWVPVGLLSVAILYNIFTGLAENGTQILLYIFLLGILSAIDIYLRTALISRFKKFVYGASGLEL